MSACPCTRLSALCPVSACRTSIRRIAPSPERLSRPSWRAHRGRCIQAEGEAVDAYLSRIVAQGGGDLLRPSAGFGLEPGAQGRAVRPLLHREIEHERDRKSV